MFSSLNKYLLSLTVCCALWKQQKTRPRTGPQEAYGLIKTFECQYMYIMQLLGTFTHSDINQFPTTGVVTTQKPKHSQLPLPAVCGWVVVFSINIYRGPICARLCAMYWSFNGEPVVGATGFHLISSYFLSLECFSVSVSCGSVNPIIQQLDIKSLYFLYSLKR